MKNKLKKILNIFSYILLILVIIVTIFLLISRFTNKVPSIFGYRGYVIISGSMMPNIDVGDFVIIKNVKEDEIKLKDIIAYRENKSIVSHRVVDIKNKNGKKIYITKGDFNNINDDIEITYEIIEGKIVKVIPKIGNILLFIKNNILIFGIIIALFIVISR